MATEQLDVDLAARDDLQKLGYTQEMSRSRGLPHILFMTLAIMAVPYGLAAPIATSLVGGGPAVMIWGCVRIPSVFLISVCFFLLGGSWFLHSHKRSLSRSQRYVPSTPRPQVHTTGASVWPRPDTRSCSLGSTDGSPWWAFGPLH